MREKPILLVVDDKANMLRLMAKVMKRDVTVLTAPSGAEAIRVLTDEPIDAVLCDLQMPDMDGLSVLRACKRLRPDAEFVLMTAYASVGTAVEALKLGAYDYLTKPFEPEAARAVLLRALARTGVSPRERSGLDVLPGVIGRSPAMLELADLVRRIADSDATTLLLGETGTGKERVARAVHALSPRADQRFIALNCAAVPAELLESELFGHARGAFTGATSERRGLFEEATGGSLFLDEIGEMRPSLQAKLTRVLEERAVRRIGESQERPVDFRLIAATHRDVEAMIPTGAFREDLWYRLNVALLRLPPLRERSGDVEVLAQHFLREQLERGHDRAVRGFSEGAREALLSYAWPGNVRQLRSAVERGCVVARGSVIQAADLPPELLREGGAADEDTSLADETWAGALERARAEVGTRYLQAVLRRFSGRVAEAAEHAGVERESFYRLLRKHGVDPVDYRIQSSNLPNV